ncbi:MAG: YlaH-like family protein [Paenibacillus sp.]|uniref:YlaH-like protein n=1 Tax=Paenibacillus aquistagni TaxID=1852522 RepID=A0A1X7IFP4_9BACL|nr:YlaH-like family protein [Paenibacillus aquistagni]MBR2569915.1 YlaH-like family protein [Paenibacillus sp.]SMG13002.1 YlaH-like protein [Paenibacillus aquistagni]
MQTWLAEHPLVSYVLIFLCVMYIFNKVFRVRKLPILQEVAIHVLMAIGCFLLLIFQIDKLPILQCLLVAVALMFMVRVRYFVEARQKKKEQHS